MNTYVVNGVEHRWSGTAACLCSHCGRIFTAIDAFDRHYLVDQASGEMECFDPAILHRKDGGPMFEQVEKPDWNPPYVWRRVRLDRPGGDEHYHVKNQP